LLSGLSWGETAAASAIPEREANGGAVILQAIPPVPQRIVEGLNRFQNFRGAAFQGWDASGESIYVSTRFGAVPQLHRLDAPGGARRQLTFFDEPVGGVERRPGSNELTFAMDDGGSEFYQLFAFDPETMMHRRLTDGSSRNGVPSFSPDGRRMAFLSTRRNGRSNDVWLMEVDDPSSARLLVAAPDGTLWMPGAWSPDGRQLVILNYVSVCYSRILLLDVASGEMTPILGDPERTASYMGIDPTFTAAGDALFVATDEGGEFRRLYLHSLSDGSMRLITERLNWDVTDFVLTPDGRRAAFVANQAGLSHLYLLDCETFDYFAVKSLPSGLVGRMDFSPDGSRLALTLNSSRSPDDVYTLDLRDPALAGPESAHPEFVRWTFSEVGGLDLETFVEPELVHYESFDGLRVPAFVYRPSVPGPHPVVLLIHGGPESQFRPGFNSRIQTWVAKLGVAVIAPNVRGSTGYGRSYLSLDNGFGREDSVRDIGALLDWVEAQPDLDEDRVAAYGGSYGGYMVLASLVHHSHRLRAAVEIVGISNFVTFLENTQGYRRELRRAEYGDERDPDMRLHLDRISPNRHVDRITAPLFVAQGQNDPRVPVTESEQIVRGVRSAGHDVWYMNALDEGHGFRKKQNRDLFEQLVVLFFEEHLLADSPRGVPDPGALDSPR
jgi:dipeptidyl aminopeptidase/acylaminoacyl peptidase